MAVSFTGSDHAVPATLIAHNENLRSESEQNPKLEGKVVYLKPKKV
jgi:hypothetical protein